MNDCISIQDKTPNYIFILNVEDIKSPIHKSIDIVENEILRNVLNVSKKTPIKNTRKYRH